MSGEKQATDSAQCLNCALPIGQKYAGTFWKAPDPMPMMWVHANGDRACSYATPDYLPEQHRGRP